MSVLKNSIKDKFLSIPNEIIEDSSLSHGAFRVYCYIASKSEGWKVRNTDIQKRLCIKQPQTLANYLKELVVAGWLRRTKSKDEKGKLVGGFDYYIMEKPQSQETLFMEKPTLGKNNTHSNTNSYSNTNSSSNIDYNKLITLFNSITGKKSRVVTDKVKKQIRARMKEGFTGQDLKNAITNCFNDDFHKEQKHKFLTLEFITRPDQLEKFSSMTVVKSQEQNLTDEQRAENRINEIKAHQ